MAGNRRSSLRFRFQFFWRSIGNHRKTDCCGRGNGWYDIIEKEYLDRPIIQKTNRWVYWDESFSKIRTDTFLYKNLKKIESKMEIINKFLKNATVSMELILYTGNRTDITLSVRNIDLLKKIGIDFSISFC